jgi:hypothetical protein
LATCLGNAMTGLAMPKAPSKSTAEVEFVLSPGDRPNTTGACLRSAEEPSVSEQVDVEALYQAK